jgi:hypothetical protein
LLFPARSPVRGRKERRCVGVSSRHTASDSTALRQCCRKKIKEIIKTTHSRTALRLSLALALLGGAANLLNVSAPIARRVAPQGTPDVPADAPRAARPASPTTPEQAREAYGRIELGFEANRGQTDASVNFLARGAGYTIFLKPTEAVFVLSHRGAQTQDSPAQTSAQRATEARSEHEGNAARGATHEAPKVLRMKLVGSSETAMVAADDELDGRVNYLLGNDPAKWRTDVPTYGRVRYGEVYPGVDLVYYGNQRQLEYDFRIAPGREASAVKLQFDGADKVEVDAAGDLLLTLGDAVVRQPKPVVYQEVNGARRAVEGGYVIEVGGQVGFRVGGYDRGVPLVIDPVIVYSTYLGGDNTDLARAIAVDPSGEACITGYTQSLNFPTANALQGTFNGTAGSFGNRDVFVTKINAAGNALVYSTYLGGSVMVGSTQPETGFGTRLILRATLTSPEKPTRPTSP